MTWKAPSDDGGSPVTEYIVQKREALHVTWQTEDKTSETEFECKKLTEGVNYIFRIAAINKVGTGEFEELAKSVSPKSPYGKHLVDVNRI